MATLRGGSTGIRVDSVAGWIIPRSKREVPAGVREIDIHSHHLLARVRRPTKVRTIIRWFDSLDIVQGGPPLYHCPPLIGGHRVVLDFRGAGHVLLARARLNSAGPSNVCNPIEFSIHWRTQTPLIGLTFWNRVKRLVGIAGR